MSQVGKKRREYMQNIRRESIQGKMKFMRINMLTLGSYSLFAQQVDSMIEKDVRFDQVLTVIKNKLDHCFSEEYSSIIKAAFQTLCIYDNKFVSQVKIEQFLEVFDIIKRDIEEDHIQKLIRPQYVNWMCEEVVGKWLNQGKFDDRIFYHALHMSLSAAFQSNTMSFDFQQVAEKIINSQFDYQDPSLRKILSLTLWWCPLNSLRMKSKQKLYFFAKNIYNQIKNRNHDNSQLIFLLRCIGYHIDFTKQNNDLLRACLTPSNNQIETKMLIKFLERQSWISDQLTYNDIEQAMHLVAKKLNQQQIFIFYSTLKNVIYNQRKYPLSLTKIYCAYFKNNLFMFQKKRYARIFAEFLSYFTDIGLADEDERLIDYVYKCLQDYSYELQRTVKFKLIIFLMQQKHRPESQLMKFLTEKEVKQFYSLPDRQHTQQEDDC